MGGGVAAPRMFRSAGTVTTLRRQPPRPDPLTGLEDWEQAQARAQAPELSFDPQVGGGAGGLGKLKSTEETLRQNQLSDVVVALRKYFAYVQKYALELSSDPEPYAQFIIFALAARGGFLQPVGKPVQLRSPAPEEVPICTFLHEMWRLHGLDPRKANHSEWTGGGKLLAKEQLSSLERLRTQGVKNREAQDAMTHISQVWDDVCASILVRFADVVKGAQPEDLQSTKYVFDTILSAYVVYNNACVQKLQADVQLSSSGFPSPDNFQHMTFDEHMEGAMQAKVEPTVIDRVRHV